jgi:DNA-binding NarL/FixJ family response regulator
MQRLDLTILSKGLVAEDQLGMRKAITDTLPPHFDVVEAVSGGKAALAVATRTHPDVVLLDVAVPRLNSIAAAMELKRKRAGAEIVFVTGQEDNDFVSAALEVEARGYVITGTRFSGFSAK